MKKLILSLLLISYTFSFTQSLDFNLQKYWYLRWRLKNYFMVVGPNYGEGYPAAVRGWVSDNMNFGDTPNHLATYMGVLATEIKILKSKGMDYSETKRELYYALYALNRLDDCEDQYPWGGFDEETYEDLAYPSSEIGDYVPNPDNLNGACLRLDVPHNFVHKNYDVLHKNLGINFTNNHFGNPPILGFDNIISKGMGDEGLNKQFGIESMIPYGWPSLDLMLYENVKVSNGNVIPNYGNRIWTHAIDNVRSFSMLSQDHISSLYMGLALITKSIDEDETYNGMAFQDGESSFVKEARNITTRLRSYMRSTNYNLRLVNGDPVQNTWGGDAFLFSHGFGKSAKWILQGDENYDSSTSGTEELFEFSWRIALGAYPGENSSNAWIVLKLFAVGNNSSRPFFPESPEVNQEYIYNLSHGNAWQSYYPLIHSYLHNVPPLTSFSQIENDLNQMPCAGNYFVSGNLSPGWATPLKYHHIEFDNLFGAVFDGTFNGLEYMLMMNLTVLKFPDIFYDYKYNNFSGKMEEEYPHVLPTETFGANPIAGLDYDIKPAVIYSIEPLVINTKVKNGLKTISKFEFTPLPHFTTADVFLNANVTFRSVGEIVVNFLDDDPGTTFEIVNEPYECNATGTGYEYVLNDELKENKQNKLIDAQSISIKNLVSTQIQVYPNPSKEFIQVSKNGNNISKIQIQNVLGNVVYETYDVQEITQINLQNLKKGLYLVICETLSENMVFKILKE